MPTPIGENRNGEARYTLLTAALDQMRAGLVINLAYSKGQSAPASDVSGWP